MLKILWWTHDRIRTWSRFPPMQQVSNALKGSSLLKDLFPRLLKRGEVRQKVMCSDCSVCVSKHIYSKITIARSPCLPYMFKVHDIFEMRAPSERASFENLLSSTYFPLWEINWLKSMEFFKNLFYCVFFLTTRDHDLIFSCWLWFLVTDHQLSRKTYVKECRNTKTWLK